MGIPRDINHSSIREWAILTGWRGSIAHNMYIPGTDPNSIDDKDLMVICVPPVDYYLGTKRFGNRGRGTKEINREVSGTMWDIVVYELQKFIALLTKANPNVLSLLWLRDNHYLKISEGAELLLDNRHLFSTKVAYKSFVGYAYSQLKRMERGSKGGWQSSRRKKMFEDVGYDAKNASHLIRLLRMGYEFLMTGTLSVFRTDASQLLEIKRGEWKLEAVKEESSKWFDLTHEALLRSPLPEEPDTDAINKLTKAILLKELKLKGD